jgi:aspartate/methionine/tyrosine aminotransferase
MAAIADRIGVLGTENAFKIGDDIARCRERGMDVILLNLGEPDFDSIAEVNARGIAEIEAANTHYCDPAGILPLREAIARKVAVSQQIDVDPDQVVVVPGAKPTIGYTMQTYVNPGDEVIYPSPGFPIYESWVTYLGARPVPLRLRDERGFAFTPEDLDALITERTKLIIICSPSNPTGGVLSKADLSGIAAVVRERCGPEVRVYSDEIYQDIVFDGERHRSIAAEDGMAARTVISSGMSKGFAMTGWRLGYAVLPNLAEASIFKTLNINIFSCVPPFIQEAGREALENPVQRTATRKMVEEFQERRDWIVPALNAIEGMRCPMPKGAFYVFPNVAGVCQRLGAFEAYDALSPEAKGRTTPSGMVQMFILYRYGVATMDRNSFGSIGVEDEHFLRISIASSLDQLQRGVSLIADACDDADGFRAFLGAERLWD